MTSVSGVSADLTRRGVAFAPAIAQAAARHGVDPILMAAVAAQETGGPGSNAGRNVLGDGGHGHGLFQIDDRYHPFAASGGAMDPTRNADYAAGMLRGLLDRYGGNVREALSCYNAGRPNATGTTTRWADGKTLGYADSVLRHYERLSGKPASSATTPAPTPGPASQSSDASAFGEISSLLLGEAVAERASTASHVNALSDYHIRSYRQLAGLSPDPTPSI
ncbi:MAG TPA: transglycosylase SLT domain-containing protein [Candidatus Baltobacteraceae bacterium]